MILNLIKLKPKNRFQHWIFSFQFLIAKFQIYYGNCTFPICQSCFKTIYFTFILCTPEGKSFSMAGIIKYIIYFIFLARIKCLFKYRMAPLNANKIKWRPVYILSHVFQRHALGCWSRCTSRLTLKHTHLPWSVFCKSLEIMHSKASRGLYRLKIHINSRGTLSCEWRALIHRRRCLF